MCYNPIKDSVTISDKKLKQCLAVVLLLVVTIVVQFAVILLMSNSFNERETLLGREYREIVAKAKVESFQEGVEFQKTSELNKKGLQNKPFQFTTRLDKETEILSLALGVYGEARGDSNKAIEDITWAIVNRVVDERTSVIYRDTISGVLISPNQYDAMKPYMNAVNSLVYGDITKYTPHSASKKGTADNMAWNKILKLSREIVEGKRYRTTIANHFWSPTAAKSKTFPEFLTYLKPLGASGGHLLFVDYAYQDGKKVYLTKENPYNPKIHQ